MIQLLPKSRRRKSSVWDFINRCLRIRRLLRPSGLNLHEALDLLEDQLEMLAEEERRHEEREDADFPAWLFGDA